MGCRPRTRSNMDCRGDAFAALKRMVRSSCPWPWHGYGCAVQSFVRSPLPGRAFLLPMLSSRMVSPGQPVSESLGISESCWNWTAWILSTFWPSLPGLGAAALAQGVSSASKIRVCGTGLPNPNPWKFECMGFHQLDRFTHMLLVWPCILCPCPCFHIAEPSALQ